MRLTPSHSQIPKEELRRIGPQIQKQEGQYSLLDWLSERHPFFDRAHWASQITNDKITVNQRVIQDCNHRLNSGDQIARLHPIDEEPEVNTELAVLWSNPDICFVSKPAGLPMHESGYFRRRTVRWILPQILGPDWHAVHRLDRETSGILMCGKGMEMRRLLAQMLEQKQIKKTYLAVCVGIPNTSNWQVNRKIVPSNSPLERARCVEESESIGLEALTDFKLLKILDGGFSLIEASPTTGRTHQIRLHLASCGLPIVGDKLYGADENIFQEYIRDGNTDQVQSMAGARHHLLHAWTLKLVHPISQEIIEIVDNSVNFLS